MLGLQIELAEDFEAGISLSRASPISSRALISDPEAHSAASTDLTEGMLLAFGSEEDVTRIEVDIVSEPTHGQSDRQRVINRTVVK